MKNDYKNFFYQNSIPESGIKKEKKVNGRLKADYMREYMNKRAAAGRDIGSIPKIKNPERRKKCSKSIELFLTTYMPEIYYRPFSEDHRRAIKKMETCIFSGGLFAFAFPRGSGKTSISEGAVLFATFYNYRNFVVIIGSSQTAADEILESIQTEITSNELLEEDFPEIIYPIKMLNGIALRAKGQTYEGEKTYLEFSSDKVVFPYLKNIKTSGNIITAKGLTSNIRGMKHKTPTGEQVRPDFVIADDPQDDESARSPTQCEKREKLIKGAVLGLAGMKKQIAVFMPCTIIQKNDVADRFLNHEKNADWQGEKTKLVYKFPDAQDTLWKEYEIIRSESILAGEGLERATEFYIENREKMDQGAIVPWKHRMYENEISALQHAENLLFERGEMAFFAEYQNEPRAETKSLYNISEDLILSRINNYARLIIPDECNFLTVGIDINYVGLHYQIIATANDATGYVVDYGKYPERESEVLFESTATTGATEAQAIYEGLFALVDELCNLREYRMLTSGVKKQFDGIIIDCGGPWMKTVFRACAQLNMLMPVPVIASRGRNNKGYKPTRTIGKIGDNWHKTRFVNMDNGLVIVHNSDIWRMRYQKAFLGAPGSPGSISLYGSEKKRHKKLAEHIVAEKLTEFIRGDTADYYNWSLNVGQSNDLLDAGVMAYVAGSVAGATLIGEKRETIKPITIKRKIKGKVSYEDS